jgi:nucleoside-diphosphate-sugar epimerase
MDFEVEYLISGSSGFLGKYFIEYSRKNNLTYRTLGRNKSNYIPFKPENFKTFIHLASKAHVVPKTKSEEEEFFNVNYYSLKNLLEEFEKTGIEFQNFIYMSSVSVYGLTEGEGISENAPLNATEPYGKSKIFAEELIQEWCKKKNINCTILRLPLIFGKNPPGNLGDLIEYLQKGKYFHIKEGVARKSIVCAVDMPKNLNNFEKYPGIYNLTDRQHPSFKELTEKICDVLNLKQPKNVPYPILITGAKVGDVLSKFMNFPSSRLEKMSNSLTFNDNLAYKTFDWSPRKVLDNINELK